jgi:hypothetical protein
MKTIAKYIPAAALGTLLLIGGTNKASAVTIYSQTFTGGTGALVSTTSTTGGGTWAGVNIINRNGLLEGEWGAASLAFTPTSGLVYELTANISSQYWGSWIGVGFLEANTTYGFLGTQNTPAALRTETGWQIWPQGVNASALTSNNVTIRLDTTLANWTTSIYQGGTQIGSTYTYTTNPTITRVGFVSDGSGGQVNAFQLTAVPEPSTYAMVLGGLLNLSLIRRRRVQA